jgi:hypothetical protein
MDRRVLTGRGPVGLPTRQPVKRLIAIVFALGLLFAGTTGLLFAGTTPRAMAGPGPGMTVDERNITNTSDFRGGEPEIAVDPTNPANIVYVANAIRYFRVDIGGEYVTLPSILDPSGNQANCFIFYTNDGGKLWQQAAGSPTPSCIDPMVAVDKYGTFYFAHDYGSGVAVVYSTDDGADWSQPVLTGTQEDRPFLRVDRSSGKLYIQSGTSGRFMAFAAGVPHDCQQNDARAACHLTWSTPVAWPSAHIAVSNGILAAAVQQATIPGSTTQLTFEYSNDDWKQVTTEAVTDSNGNPVTGGKGDFVTADPNTPNRFAVMQQSGNTLQIYVTNDNGQHWSGPTVVYPDGPLTNGMGLGYVVPQEGPWIDYSVDEPGVLGLVYKTYDKQGNMDVWSVVSLNNGVSFSKPLQLNAATAGPPESATQLFGDDLSWVLIANKTVYAGYGQMAPCTVYGKASSCLNSFLAQVPLTAYRPLGAGG